jgi:hypothetical protein
VGVGEGHVEEERGASLVAACSISVKHGVRSLNVVGVEVVWIEWRKDDLFGAWTVKCI